VFYSFLLAGDILPGADYILGSGLRLCYVWADAMVCEADILICISTEEIIVETFSILAVHFVADSFVCALIVFYSVRK